MIIRPDTGSWSGFADSFGERATAVDVDGRSVDLLRLFAAFTPASQALTDRILLLGLDRPGVSRAIVLERDEPSSRLLLVSEHVPGVRLSELLQTAVQRSVVADLGAALFVMRRLLALAESLNAGTGLARFSIAPERIVVTPHGRVVIVEPVLAAAAETVGIASDDIAGIAIAGLSIMLGHLIEDAEQIDPLSPVLQDAADVAAIRADLRFSTALRLWFDRAIIADPTLKFAGFRQARLALPRARLARNSGCGADRRTLKAFLDDLAIDRLTETEAGALEVDRLRKIRTTRRARRKAISAPDEEWITVEGDLFIGDESGVAAEASQRTLVDLPGDVVVDRDSLSGERADEAIGIDPLAHPAIAAPVEETLEASVAEETSHAVPIEEAIEAEPAEEAPEAAPIEEPIDAEPAEKPLEAAQFEETPEAAPIEKPIDAEPAEEPLDAAQFEETPEAAPIEEPIDAEPAEEPLDAAQFEETPEAAPIEEPIDAEPAEEPLDAAQFEETPETAPIEEPIEAEPVEETPEAVLVKEWLIEADPVQEQVWADPAPSPESWLRSMAWPRGVASAEPQPLQTDITAPPGDEPLEGLPAEQTEPVTEPLVADPEVAAWPSPVSTEPEFEEASTDSGTADQEGPREIDVERLEIDDTDPPVETVEEWLAEEAEPAAVDTLDQSRSMEAAFEEPQEIPTEVTQDLTAASADEDESTPIDAEAGAEPDLAVEPFDAPLENVEPVAPVDASIAARLAEDAHTSWILSISEQVGRMRRREQGLLDPPVETTAAATDATAPVDEAETEPPGEHHETVEEAEALFSDEAADAPAVQTADPQLEQATAPHAEERTEHPAWTTPEPVPWGDAISASGTAVPFPAGPVDHEYTPLFEGLHEQEADAQPLRPDAQRAKMAPSPRTIAVAARRWTRAVATIVLAGLALGILGTLVIAGRSYYRKVNAPGTIAVDSTPRGSEVLVDGTTRGITPLTLTLRPGDHVLALRRNGLTRRFPIAVAPAAQLSQQLDWSTVRATGTLAISSTPSQAKVTVDGKDRGVTPITLSDVAVGMRQIVIQSTAGTVRREVQVVADSQVTINETIISGWIAAFAPIELQIYDGTRLLGTTGDDRIMVRPGRHELDFVNTRLGFRERRGIDVTPGMTTAVNIATGVGIVRITAPAGADVLIDGVLFGETPLRELSLPIGSHEIVLRHPQLGEQRVSVTVGASAPTDVSVDFTK